jgi:tetratricopeptide (TPR) repeat protein
MATGDDPQTIAFDFHRAGKLAEAEQLYRQILQADPRNHRVLHMLGVANSQMGQHEAGIQCISQAIVNCPTNPNYHNSLGEIYLTTRRNSEARPCFEQALRLNPSYWAAHFNLGLLTGIDLPGEAQGHYERTIALAPHYVPARINLGNVLRAQGKLEEAVAAYRDALAAQPYDNNALANLGGVLTELGRVAEANEVLQTVVGLTYSDISHRHRCIFIHIPKNAGTSIRDALHLVGGGHRPWHYHAKNLPHIWQQYVSFGIIRNPWDRAVSAYHHARMPESFWHDQRLIPHPDYRILADKSFEECLSILCRQPGRLSHASWLDQSQWIVDAKSPNKTVMVETVLRYETLADDFAKLCDRLSIDCDALPTLNTSGRSQDYRSQYNEQTKAMVEQLYAEDIRMFGYTF